MISSKTNRRRRAPVAARSETAWRRFSPAPVGEITQLMRYLVLRVDRTTTGELVAMERYPVKDPSSAVENARLLAGEAAGAVAYWVGERAGTLSSTGEIIETFGLRPDEARRLLATA
jgi:hypothetical protein